MRITVHRGINQIGGCITEIATTSSKILIDLGGNLPDGDGRCEDRLAEDVYKRQVFEQWILQHENEADKTFVFKGNEKYTLRMILNEIRLGTGFGKDIERIMYKSTIQSLLDSKLDD